MKNCLIKTYLDRDYDSELLGGKGRNLGILTRNGLPVPPWFCILSQAYDDFITPFLKDLEKLLIGIDYENIEEVSGKILELLQSQEISQSLVHELEEKIGDGDPQKYFAVRSSGCKEDKLNHSFAGLFETYLYTPREEIADYIKSCWLSVFTPRALSYLHKNGLSPFDIKMAVIVQEMVPSEKSGVLFQANPVGKMEEIVVIAGYGLGEGIVTSQTETDTYFYNRLSKEMTTRITEKKSCFCFDAAKGKNVIKTEVNKDLGNTSVLSENELKDLIDISYSIEKLYDHYQDIEWAIHDQKIYILQSRPITTIPTGELQLYDNSNIIESYPGISSPLTFTLVRRGYEKNFGNSLIRLGVPKGLIAKNNRHFSEMIEIIQGRIYYNLTNWYHIISLLPSGSGDLKNYLDEMIGVRKQQEVQNLTRARLANFFRELKISINLLYKFLRWERFFKQYQREFECSYRQVKNTLRKDLDTKSVKRKLVDYFNEIFTVINLALINDLFLMILMGISKRLINYLSNNSNINSEELINGLLVGEKDMESVKPVRALLEMAVQVRNSEYLHELLDQDSAFLNLELISFNFPEFHEKFLEYLEKYGDRGIGELKLEVRSFRQEPGDLAKIILNYADSGLTTESMIRRESDLRLASEKQLDDIFKQYRFRKKVVDYFIHKLRFFIRNRETARMDRSRFFGVFREIFLKIGAIWAAQDFILDIDDIFYLTFDEVLEMAESPNKDYMQEAIVRRKKEYETYRSQNPADRMWLKGDAARNYIPQKSGMNKSGTLSPMQGIGCCPGQVTGEAVILHAPKATANVKDKILVAENTDPGWVYLIIGSRGLIVEKGSLLSHTAIIGRELGIPTIVGVNNATSTIPDGAYIKMDGGLGTFEILKGPGIAEDERVV